MWGRKCFLWTLAMVFFCLSAIAFTDGPPSTWPAADVFLIDNFDKGTLTGTPRWWSFDRVALSFHESELEQNSLYALHVGGTAENYYVGGIGTYIGKDLPGYNTLSMDVKGSGLNSCRIKIELYQNDRGDWQMAQDGLGPRCTMLVLAMNFPWIGQIGGVFISPYSNSNILIPALVQNSLNLVMRTVRAVY